MRSLILLLAAVPWLAAAHAPDPMLPAAAAWNWNLAPWLVMLLLAAALGYGAGLWRLWANAGRGRGVSLRQAGAFGLGWLALAAALLSPLDSLGGWLFSAHMVQHELLMVVAAPLLVVGRPLATWAWALSPRQRRSVGRWVHGRHWAALWAVLTDPLAAWAMHALALWAWHVPAAFEAALRHEGWHILQHSSFFGTALFFWWATLGRDPRGRYGPGHSAAYLFTTMLHTAALGALLSLAPTPWYAPYIPATGALGFDPVEDQQLGGLVMWVPAGLAYVAATLAVVGRTLLRARA